MSSDRGRVPESPQLGVHVARTPARTVVSVSGELDLATAAQFVDALRTQLAGGPVLLDLAELRFMGSAGIQALDTLLREIEREAWTFAVHGNLQRPVRRILELTGMLNILPLVDGPIGKEEQR